MSDNMTINRLRFGFHRSDNRFQNSVPVLALLLYNGHGVYLFDFIECFTTFLRAHSWLNGVDEDDDEVGLKEKPEDTRYIKKITSK